MHSKDQSRSQAFEAAEDRPSNISQNATLGDVIQQRFSRRTVLQGSLAVAAVEAILPGPFQSLAAHAEAGNTSSSPFVFTEVVSGEDANHYVAEGYRADILIRWGDPVLPGATPFDPAKQNAKGQALQFGYNNDYIGFIPLDDTGNRGLLVINHEYTNEELMFPGLIIQEKERAFQDMTADLVAIEMMAHGGSVIEIEKHEGTWRVVSDSKYARRITAETPMLITGPAAGHEALNTSADPTGTKVLGMLNNCGGGVTPWGTWLSCEENFNGYFWGKNEGHKDEVALRRYGAPSNWYNWGQYHDRFDIAKEPNEINRFGWVVEIDPFDPASIPKKRTALGRFKHEAAAGILNSDGRYVIYMGDDQRFDYVYKFVTDGKHDPANRAANLDLLDNGTLYAARFEPDGTGRWLPLKHGVGPLGEHIGFKSQGDVLVHTRIAADYLSPTKMDRPEDVEVNPETGKVYVILTLNEKRSTAETDAANPRGGNPFGHIIEITPHSSDHASDLFSWDILVKCGDPSIANVGATFNLATSKHGWFANPDNCAIDSLGRLWIATDGNNLKKTGRTDGLWALETEGPGRATGRLFYRCPVGAELCGPVFTPGLDTVFVAVQHPGAIDDDDPNAKPSTFDDPSTRWPDFKEGIPPRPSVVAITRTGGGKIAT